MNYLKQNRFIILFIITSFLLVNFNSAIANDLNNNSTFQPQLDIYKVDLESLYKSNVYKKGAKFELVLLDDIFTKTSENGNPVMFYLINGNNKFLKATGYISKQSSPMRLSIPASVELATNKLYLENGDSVNFSASSFQFSSIHPSHVDSRLLRLARFITGLTVASSPLTLGTSLGISFLVNGLLSAYKNGASDFIWGGLDGTGLSFIENMLRKQPDVYLSKGSVIPFTLSEDLKITKGIQKETKEIKTSISSEEAISKIQNLIEMGDLSGALEMSFKTNQTEKYNEILKKISL